MAASFVADYPAVCFVTDHPNSANHFAEFALAFQDRDIPCKMIAEKKICSSFSQLKASPIAFDSLALETEEGFAAVEKEAAKAAILITDCAGPHWEKLHLRLSQKFPKIKRCVYYDNPERFVPGGYSERAAKIASVANTVLFSNKAMAETGVEKEPGILMDLAGKQLIGIGYYPTSEAEKILRIRQDPIKAKEFKEAFFERHQIDNRTPFRVFAYIGGANEYYYTKAFPHFINLLRTLAESGEPALEHSIFILQQHPRAKTDGSPDGRAIREFLLEEKLPKTCRLLLSDLTTIEALAISDAALYYQTSMAAQFALANIPCVMQIGPDTYPDLLIRAGFPSITSSEQLKKALALPSSQCETAKLERELGRDPDWKARLLNLCL